MKFGPLRDRVFVKGVDGEEKTERVAIPNNSRDGDTVVIDRSYIRAQAYEALKTFVAPLSGVYAAAFGPISTAPKPAASQKATNGD